MTNINKVISWVGTITSIGGAFLVALGLMQLGYISFLIGSTSWLYVGVKVKDSSLITLNGVFMIANIIGTFRSFV